VTHASRCIDVALELGGLVHKSKCIYVRQHKTDIVDLYDLAADDFEYFGDVHNRLLRLIQIVQQGNADNNAAFGIDHRNAGVGGSSPPVATNSFSALRAENVSLHTPQSDSEFAKQNCDSVHLECCAQTVPNLRPKVTPSLATHPAQSQSSHTAH